MTSELKSVLRSLVRVPGYSLTVVGTLALGIGAAAAFYSLVAGSLFPPMPFTRPEELVRIETFNREQSQGQAVFLLRFAAYWQERSSFSGIAGSTHDSLNVWLNEEPEGVNAARVTANYFTVLGAAPALGRTFLPDEGQAGSDQVVVLSDWFWRNRMGGDPTVLDRELMVNGRPHRIVGVLDRDFRAPLSLPNGRIYVPLVVPVEVSNQQAFNPVFTVGRLRPGFTAEQGQAELRTLLPEKDGPFAAFMEKFDAVVAPVDTPPQWPGYIRYRMMLWTGVGAVVFLYAIACVNAGNLMLVRALGRRRETGIRLALGGGRWDVARPLLWEGLLLATAAILLGIVVAKWLMPALVALAPGADEMLTRNLKLSWEALGVLALVGFLSGILIAAGPAWRAAHLNVNDAVKEGGAALGESPRLRLVRGGLVVLEAALAVVLLTGAGLMVRTFTRLQQVNPGFTPDLRFSVQLQISREENLSAAVRTERYKQIAERLERVPGVVSASLASTIVPNYYYGQKLKIAGRSDDAEIEAQAIPGAPDFLEAMGVPVRAGRSLATVRQGDAPAVVINETMARTYFEGRNPVGEQLQLDAKTRWEIIGVVGDMRSAREGARPRYYFPYWQPRGHVNGVLLRTSGEPGPKFINEIRSAVYEVDPKFAVMGVTALDRQLKQEVQMERNMLVILEVLSGLALLLAAVGLFTMMAFTVAQRRAEFGIRCALGATPDMIHRLVLKRGLALAAAGVAIGLGLALVLSRLLAAMLYETKAADPLTYAIVGVGMLLVAVPACWLPARRSSRVDLVNLLRTS